MYTLCIHASYACEVYIYMPAVYMAFPRPGGTALPSHHGGYLLWLINHLQLHPSLYGPSESFCLAEDNEGAIAGCRSCGI